MKPIDNRHREQIMEIETTLPSAPYRIIRFLNIVLIVCVIFVFYDVMISRRIPENFNRIFLPIFTTLTPFAIISLYPRIHPVREIITGKPILNLRMSIAGAGFLSLSFNLFTHIIKGWHEPVIAALVICYFTALILPLKPLFNEAIIPFRSWTKDDFVLKSIGITSLCMITSYLWDVLNPSNPIIGLLTQGRFHLIQIAGLTVLIPFFIGLALSNLPCADGLKTFPFEEEFLKEKFGR